MITLDVRTKLLGLLVFVLAVSLVRSVWLAAACVGVGLAAALAAGVPPGGLVRRLAWVAYLSAGLFLTFPLVWGRPEGLALAGLASLRIVACLLGALALTASASVPQVLDAMAGLGIPRLFVALCGMTVRYMAVLQGEALRQQVSRRSRCWRPGRFLWSGRTLSTAAHSLGMLLLRAYDRSERIYRSMLSRGYSPVAGVTGIEPAIAGCRAGVAPGEPVAEDAVCVTDLHFRFPDGTPALASVNLRIGRGRRVALMGPNGAGKSTLLLHLNAIHLPQRGSVTVEGLAVSRDTEDAVRRRVGLVFQDPDDQVFSPTVWEDVCFGPLNLGLGKAEVEARAERALAATGLLDMRLRLPQRLSYGQRKRAAIAGVLAMEPSILALDEPLAFLDPEAQDGLLAILADLHAQGATLVVATHDVDWAAGWADEVVVLADGQVLAQGTPGLLADPALARRARLRVPRGESVAQIRL